MAAITKLAQVTAMNIILCMTRIAIGRCPFEHIIWMAIDTGDEDVFSGQLKGNGIMVERRGQPASRAMAGCTARTQITLMGIILGMTGITILGGRFHIRNCACPGVALGAGHLGMFPGKLKNYQAMVESVAVSVHPIMTAQAFIPISLQMGLHKISLDLSVAGCAYGLVKPDIVVGVTICAFKRASVRFSYMRSQRVSKDSVIDLGLAHVNQSSILTAVFQMAIPAGQSRTVLEKLSMERGRIT
jgi:hypothetical protein